MKKLILVPLFICFIACSSPQHEWHLTERSLGKLDYTNRIYEDLETLSKSRFDSQLDRDAKLALALNSNLVGNNIDVYVKHGIIYLSGTVQRSSQKELAGQIVALGRRSFVVKNLIEHLE